MSELYSIPVKNIQGKETSLAEYKGKVLLIVNVASQCGLTPQYTGLEELNAKYKDKGLVILGFPCNQFAGQEPGTEKDIQQFCDMNYKITFPLFAKIEVNGSGTHPLYQHLKSKAKGLLGTEAIKWNFTKFLVSRDGEVIKRFAPNTEPKDLEKDVAQALG